MSIYTRAANISEQVNAGADAFELANARRMAEITGRDMRDWMPQPDPTATYTYHCSTCDWSGNEPDWADEANAYCPTCGNEAW